MRYFLYLNKSRDIVIAAPGSKLPAVIDALQKVWKKSLGSSKVSHVFCTRYHFSICFKFYVPKEHFWVVINVLWISKDAIYNNTSEICNGSFRFDFCLLSISFTLMCCFQPLQATVAGNCELCPMSVPVLRVIYTHKRQLEAIWDMLHVPSYNESMDTVHWWHLHADAYI